MAACVIYLIITAYSIPFLAVYDAGAAMLRSIEKTYVTMIISTVANIVNIIGDVIGTFVLHLGAAGVHLPDHSAQVFGPQVM